MAFVEPYLVPTAKVIRNDDVEVSVVVEVFQRRTMKGALALEPIGGVFEMAGAVVEPYFACFLETGEQEIGIAIAIQVSKGRFRCSRRSYQAPGNTGRRRRDRHRRQGRPTWGHSRRLGCRSTQEKCPQNAPFRR